MISRQASPRLGRLAGLAGSIAALATPFRHGEVDLEALERLCDRQLNHGTAAIVVCGSTGEAPALSLDEQGSIIAMAVAAVGRRIPVIAGCAGSATAQSVALASNAARHGAAGILCAPPPYVKPTQQGIAAHVQAVAYAAALPVVLYDVPSRTGVAIADDTVARLFESGGIVAIKDAAGDLSRPSRLRALCGVELLQFSGDDATADAYRAVGGHGCVSVTANIAPALCAQLHASWASRDLASFDHIRDVLAPLNVALFLESNPIPLKAALAILHLCTDDLRLPLTRASHATRDRLARILPDILAAEKAASQPTRTLLRLVPRFASGG